MRNGAKASLVGLAGLVGAALYWRRNPSACPYSQRFFIEAPHPIITRARLLEVLRPTPGERLLEVGPGTGYYTLTVAEALHPGGTLDIFDIQQEMLDHTMERVRAARIDNVVPRRGDAQALPYETATFAGVFLATVLGEIRDQDRAVTEFARVLAPGGRLVVGELMGDPHMVRFNSLWERCERAGLVFEERSGNPLGYFARFRRPPGVVPAVA